MYICVCDRVGGRRRPGTRIPLPTKGPSGVVSQKSMSASLVNDIDFGDDLLPLSCRSSVSFTRLKSRELTKRFGWV